MARRQLRIHVHFNPTSGSWLNLVEAWIAMIDRQTIRRLSRSSWNFGGGPDDQLGGFDGLIVVGGTDSFGGDALEFGGEFRQV